MNTHRLFAVVALCAFEWGCGSDNQTYVAGNEPREATVAKTLQMTLDCKLKTLSVSPPSTEPSGTPILLVADTSCTQSEYRFLYKPVGNDSCGNGGNGPWIELRDWGGPTFTFDTTGLCPSRYMIRAESRTDGGGESNLHVDFEFTEACAPGYGSDGAGTCVDINECLTANGACDPLASCTNVPGSRSCGPCPSGYSGSGDTACMLPFIASELVGRPTDHSVTINAMAGQALEAYFDYGTAPGVYGSSTSPTVFADGIIETVISGLSPDTRFYYRMRYRPSGSAAPFLVGNEYTFHTQRSRSSTFTFAVQSDSHQGYAAFYNDDLYRTTMGNILSAQPDFLMDLGDTVSTDDMTETQASVRQKYLNQRTIFDLAGHFVPGQCRCGTPDTDSDGDGTADCHDRCPADPLKITPGSCGCGVIDSERCCQDGQCARCSTPGIPDVGIVVAGRFRGTGSRPEHRRS